MRNLLLLTLLAAPAHAQTHEPFSAALLPEENQTMHVVNQNLPVTGKTVVMKFEMRNGHVGYRSDYTPFFFYLPEDQKVTALGYTVAKLVRVSKEANGVAYTFEGHEVIPEFKMEKSARLQVLRKDDGDCEMSWAMKNTVDRDPRGQAVGAVRYKCMGSGKSLNASN